jgi:hypothetical protein
MATSTLGNGTLVLAGTTSGTTTVTATAVAGTTTLTLPAATDTLVGKATTDTLTNKTLTAPTLASANITTALTLTGAAGTAGQALVSGGTGAAPTWSTVSATPGGSTTQVQYNNAGAFAGSSNFNFDGTRLQLGTTSVINYGTQSIASTSFSDYQLSLSDTRVFSSSPYATVVFGGKYNTAGTNTIFGFVKGAKENATDGNNAGFLALGTTSNGGSETERARFNSTGALVFAGGTTTANGIGITFPATQSASSDANTLDDYEEGTWTPSVGGTATYSSQTGTYTKIGRLVYIRGTIQISVIGTGSTQVISGIPFAAATNSPIPVGYCASLALSINSVVGDLASTTMYFAASTSTAAGYTQNAAVFGSSTYMNIGGSYQV